MSHETFELIGQLRQAAQRAVMATLVRTRGTTPRKEGTKMFVGESGNVFGSVTIGGCVDARVLDQAADVLATSSPRLLEMQLGDEEAWEIGLTCGGSVDVYVEPLTEDVIAIYEKARAEWDAGRGVAVATVLSGEGAGSRRLIDTEVPESSHTDGNVYIEVLRPPPTLLVFGGGAVAIPLISFAKATGFRTVVIDARPQFANRNRFPDADELRVGIASEIARELRIGAATAVVLVAHDYKIDVPVLKRALETDAPYIGLLGSRRRGAAILQMLRDEGVAGEQLARVRNPIGLDLGGTTAAEIALSIASEVVAVLHGRAGAALSQS
jgi:xanthine dehydrogenase accessory factor